MIKQIVSALILVMAGSLAALSNTLPMPEGRVILTVSGQIEVTNDGDLAVFDLAMMEGMERSSFQTSTIWTKGVITFEGVRLSTFLDQLGITEGTLKMSAVNDYSVSVPVRDASPGGPILAFRRDGKTMGVRDKGPLWLVYPYDLNPAYQSQIFQTRSIWQLDRIEVLR